MKKYYLVKADGGKKTPLDRRKATAFNGVWQFVFSALWTGLFAGGIKRGDVSKISMVLYPLVIVLSIVNGIISLNAVYRGTCPNCGEKVFAAMGAHRAKCKKCGEKSEIITETDDGITM